MKSPLPATPPAARPASMQDVARKIRGRTADLLAIAIIVGATLSFGSQIISWWRSGPPADAAGNPVLTPPGWDLDGQPVDLGFGDLPVTLTRQQIAGDHPAAVEALFEACREISMAATAPLGETPDAEQRLIERVASLTPRSELPGAWQVYVVDDAFPFVVGLKTLTVNSGTAKPPTTAPAAPTAEHSAPADSEQIPRRLVCYGLAMPAGEQAWTLFIARNSTHPTVTGATGFEIALPPGATQTLSLRDRRGSLLVGFS
ncbi:MAG: hypothetical protein JSS02_16735, partial [Planctomycetes bacterium]|nr:hypothetical protein [Planctomycetota bacterium]